MGTRAKKPDADNSYRESAKRPDAEDTGKCKKPDAVNTGKCKRTRRRILVREESEMRDSRIRVARFSSLHLNSASMTC